MPTHKNDASKQQNIQYVERPIDKISKKRVFYGMLKNDLEYLPLAELQLKIHSQSHFSILYFVLLIVSTLVCTLGLLTNSTAVVIGGMLIAPLTWPLARVGFGVSRRKPHHIYRGMMLVVASLIIGTISAYLITSISPIKIINEEILARTAPTLMDLFIALAAGLVAATAITQRKIADSLAGVAIAVSLMPPLCTVGITLALRQFSFAGGALLLFAINAACITLVTTLVISFNTYLRTKKFKIGLRAAIFNLIFVAILSIPLAFYLQRYTIQLRSYNQVATEMALFAEQKDIFAAFENISVEPVNEDTIAVSADLLIPNDSAFTYQDNEALIENIRRMTGKEVSLNLRIQTIIQPISKDQEDNQLKINQLNQQLIDQLKDIDESFRVSSVNISQNLDQTGWIVNAEVLSDPELVPTLSTVTELNERFNEVANDTVELNLTFLPQLTLRSFDQTQSQEARKIVEDTVSVVDSGAVINAFSVSKSAQLVSVTFTVTSTNTDSFTAESLATLKPQLESEFGTQVSVQTRIIQATDINL